MFSRESSVSSVVSWSGRPIPSCAMPQHRVEFVVELRSFSPVSRGRSLLRDLLAKNHTARAEGEAAAAEEEEEEEEEFRSKTGDVNAVSVVHVVSDDDDDGLFDELVGLTKWVLAECVTRAFLRGDRALPPPGCCVRSLALHPCVVCSTGIYGPTRRTIEEAVLLLGGAFARNFTSQVTHLIAITPGSDKYKAAVEHSSSCVIVTPEWLQECRQQNTCVDSSKYTLPPLVGCVISVTQVGSDHRERIRNLVVAHGGEYSPDLTTECTHLLAELPEGRKYEHALAWKLYIVHPTWFYETIKAQARLPESRFPVREELEDNEPGPEDDDMYMDACRVFLAGFTGAALKKCVAILRSGGATRLSTFGDMVTHVVVAPCEEKNFVLPSTSRVPLVVSEKWLLACHRTRKVEDPAPFLLPLDEGGRILCKGSEKGGVAFEVVRRRSDVATASPKPDHLSLGFTEMYTRDEVPTTCGATHTQAPSAAVAPGLFTGSSFALQQENKELEDDIRGCGGRILDAMIANLPSQTLHYLICEHGERPDLRLSRKAQEGVVTPQWVCLCKQDARIHDPTASILFEPWPVAPPLDGMRSLCLCVSNYVDYERNWVETLIRTLGASLTNRFLRNKNTHLVCDEPCGPKFDKACEWGIPIIKSAWLATCAKKGGRIDERSFLLAKDPSPPPPPSTRKGALEGVVVVFHRKLPKERVAELEELVRAHGGDVCTAVGKATHFICQGREGETGREYRAAQNAKTVKIVSPLWLEQCHAKGTRVDESEYPHVINSEVPEVTPTTSSVLERLVERVQAGASPKPSCISHAAVDPIVPTKRLSHRDLECEEGFPSLPPRLAPHRHESRETEDEEELIESQVVSYATGPPGAFTSPMSQHRGGITPGIGTEITDICRLMERSRGAQATDDGAKVLFQLSGFRVKDRTLLTENLRKVGLTVDEQLMYNPSITHLISRSPVRNEKYLASCAAGKWVLRPSYVEACLTSSGLAEEEPHEWTPEFGRDEDVKCTSAAARRWRLHLAGSRQLGAFSGWEVFLHVDETKRGGLQRVLEAGGACVLATHPPFPIEGGTHLFMSSVDALPDAVRALAARGVQCLLTEFIGEYLVKENADVAPYLIQPCIPPQERRPAAKRRKRAPTRL